MFMLIYPYFLKYLFNIIQTNELIVTDIKLK